MSFAEERQQALELHLEALRQCERCPKMNKPVITHGPVLSKIYLVGQAPGPREGLYGKPFAWTAGKTLFSWFAQLGVSEESFRSRAFMAAVCRCFPGKSKGGGDRVPSREEIANCSAWMQTEIQIMQPELIIPVGKLAIEAFLPGKALSDVVGQCISSTVLNYKLDLICLPHPSGASSWFKVEPGKTLLKDSLELLRQHRVWKTTFS